MNAFWIFLYNRVPGYLKGTNIFETQICLKDQIFNVCGGYIIKSFEYTERKALINIQ